MKTITIKQPWASLICSGIKDIENRTWTTKFRGRVLVHSAAKSWLWHKVIQYLSPELREFAIKNKWTRTWLENLETGAIIGSVEIVDCVVNYESVWAEKSMQLSKPIYQNYFDENGVFDEVQYNNDKVDWMNQKPIYNWVLANPIMFSEPIPAKGKLSFWEYTGELPEKY